MGPNDALVGNTDSEIVQVWDLQLPIQWMSGGLLSWHLQTKRLILNR